MKPLPLSGTATQCIGFSDEYDRCVIRLRSFEDSCECSSDFALTRTEAEIRAAVENGWESIFAICETVDESFAFPSNGARVIYVPTQYDYLGEGDVLGIRPRSLRFRTLYRRKSVHNSFLVTERCNNYCLMCSQPPKDVDDQWLLEEIKESLPLLDSSIASLTFTGGETLTDWREFISVLAVCRDKLPHTAIQVLTNGRAFARTEVVNAWRDLKHPNLIAAIPVYSSVDQLHDYVVQANGAFDETILGILKLKDRGQRIEIRIVLHALTAPGIAETCRWIARNLPFVDHVALMGLENTGFAIANDALLWIDPVDYQDALALGVDYLVAANVNVSVYNLPRCVLDRSVWPNAVQSISDWKNGYVDECDRCVEKNRCSGFFTSGRPRFSRGISAITS